MFYIHFKRKFILHLLSVVLSICRVGQICQLCCQIFHIAASFCLTLLSFTKRETLKFPSLWIYFILFYLTFGAMLLGASNLKFFFSLEDQLFNNL